MLEKKISKPDTIYIILLNEFENLFFQKYKIFHQAPSELIENKEMVFNSAVNDIK